MRARRAFAAIHCIVSLTACAPAIEPDPLGQRVQQSTTVCPYSTTPCPECSYSCGYQYPPTLVTPPAFGVVRTTTPILRAVDEFASASTFYFQHRPDGELTTTTSGAVSSADGYGATHEFLATDGSTYWWTAWTQGLYGTSGSAEERSFSVDLTSPSSNVSWRQSTREQFESLNATGTNTQVFSRGNGAVIPLENEAAYWSFTFETTLDWGSSTPGVGEDGTGGLRVQDTAGTEQTSSKALQYVLKSGALVWSLNTNNEGAFIASDAAGNKVFGITYDSSGLKLQQPGGDVTLPQYGETPVGTWVQLRVRFDVVSRTVEVERLVSGYAYLLGRGAWFATSAAGVETLAVKTGISYSTTLYLDNVRFHAPNRSATYQGPEIVLSDHGTSWEELSWETSGSTRSPIDVRVESRSASGTWTPVATTTVGKTMNLSGLDPAQHPVLRYVATLSMPADDSSQETPGLDSVSLSVTPWEGSLALKTIATVQSAGDAFELTAQVLDVYGSPNTGYAGTIVLTVSPTEGISPELMSQSNGVATWSITAKKAMDYVLTVSAPGLRSVTRSIFVQADAPRIFGQLIKQPATLADPAEVDFIVRDDWGNPYVEAGLTFGTPHRGCSVTPTVGVTDASGKARVQLRCDSPDAKSVQATYLHNQQSITGTKWVGFPYPAGSFALDAPAPGSVVVAAGETPTFDFIFRNESGFSVTNLRLVVSADGMQVTEVRLNGALLVANEDGSYWLGNAAADNDLRITVTAVPTRAPSGTVTVRIDQHDTILAEQSHEVLVSHKSVQTSCSTGASSLGSLAPLWFAIVALARRRRRSP